MITDESKTIAALMGIPAFCLGRSFVRRKSVIVPVGVEDIIFESLNIEIVVFDKQRGFTLYKTFKEGNYTRYVLLESVNTEDEVDHILMTLEYGQ